MRTCQLLFEKREYTVSLMLTYTFDEFKLGKTC